ncbi:uncharacterized protein CELE_F40G9.5 [Caenorhabditis elegans]|uniref:Uncharacterized protein n=1 Tax=Caenorhabditis elegans TaxID=6239 RepID=C0Z1Y6_CAEEL|nr:Uncharacterized protein CELE_F40G9.5 [Caenorhabditis elegans]CCD70938.1 Uncharacterized protein CELE_F40G9.5 [Caenorhabditis elegans]|eukprot:NP_497171.2 Uncharacterized protein CELE_F40G9.5 [Caenorhabditis elegans]
MIQVILYFTLNFAGFFVFLAIWNWLPKPKPFDYTTIPGMKLNVSSAEEIPEMVKLPGERVEKEFKGHFEDIKSKTSNFRELLDFLNTKYGPLSSFWWSSRYVVVVSNEKFVGELKKYRSHLVAVTPFGIGSYLHADPKYCTAQKLNTISIRGGTQAPKIDNTLSEESQNRLMMTLDSMTDDVTEKCDVAQIIDNLKQCKVQMKKNRKSLGRPLLVVFDEEIWVDAHPIPKYIPIIIHVSEIIRNWTEDELFPKYYAQFYWLPGFQMITDVS